jgi:pSer/pThr/pTyr-binding forkhead associated (FHA) protein
LIGSAAECDVVVDSPLVSARHCRLTQTPDGLLVEDLGSTHGTYVEGSRVAAPTRVAPGQEITLGQTMPMPWPSDLVKFVRIGRVPGNDIVLEDNRVSSRHARLMIVDGSEAFIEDIGSSNGTFLNSVDSRVTRFIPLSSSDTVYFGSMAVPATRLLAGLLGGPMARPRASMAPPHQPPPMASYRQPPPVAAYAEAPPAAPIREPLPLTPREPLPIAAYADAPPVASRWQPPPPPVAAPSFVSFVQSNAWLLAAFCQAPLLAFLIVLIPGRQAAAQTTDANWPSVAQAIAATSFGLTLAAVWFGCSLAVAELAGGHWPGHREGDDAASFFSSRGPRLAAVVSICALGCALMLAVVYWGAGFKGPLVPMLGILLMASIVCLLFGLLLATVVRNWQAVALILAGCCALMIVLGGWLWPLAGKGLPVSLAAGVTPSRWAFEGVLLLESPHHGSPGASESSPPAPDHDLARELFPADSERMGPGADATALAAMLLALAAAVVVTAIWPR